MTSDLMRQIPYEHEHALALLHIGMMLEKYTASEDLPQTTDETTDLIYEIFGVDMWTEPDIYSVRNKMVAIIETLQGENSEH